MLETHGPNTKKSPQIIFDIEEDEIEELSFDLADEGLGFHCRENLASEMITGPKKIAKIELNKKLLSSKSNISPIDLPQTSSGTSLPGLEESSQRVTLGVGGESFLENFNNKNIPKEEFSPGKILLKKSSIEKVAFAWVVDIILILFFIAISVVFFFALTNIPYNEVLKLIEFKEMVLFFCIFFSIFYLFYFSILDLSGTPGKLIFATKLASTKKGRLKMRQTLLRALIILCSPLFLFLPIIYGLHDTASSTQSVEEIW